MTTDQLHSTLFYGDNLTVLREQIPDESVDLIYLDPPFKSDSTYNILFRDEAGDAPPAQLEAFDDTWHWGADSERALAELLSDRTPSPQAGVLLEALVRALGRNRMTAYLSMMSVRLVELHRVLKPTGCIYLHCDQTASHYLKIVMDAIFGIDNALNHVIWNYRRWPSPSKRYQRMHDDLLFYAKESGKQTFHVDYEEVSESHRRRFGGGSNRKNPDDPTRVVTVDEPTKGLDRRDVWNDISIIAGSAHERVGYDTQKPLRLLHRIIEASSNPGDLILDPFCGCGTAMVAAEQLGRRWCGIDITHLAIGLVEDRLRELNADARVFGAPQDMISARDLARRSAFQFEAWAITRLAGFRPNPKPGGDGGIDGRMRFARNGEGGRDYGGRAVAQVKSGAVSRGDLDAFVTALDRDDADLGVFITLEALGPRHGAHAEAARAGTVRIGSQDYAKIQLWSIEDLFAGRRPELPPPIGTQQPRLI